MRLAFFGLGNMGFPISKNLLACGHTVTTAVHHSRETALAFQALGGHIAASPAEAVVGAEVIFTIVPNDQALCGLLLDAAMLDAVPAGCTIIEMTSASAEAVGRVASAYAARGASLLDAPVSGGVAGAANATMSMLCAGERAVFDRAAPLLEQISSRRCYVGPVPGQGKILKSLNNLLSAVNKTAVGEAYRMAMANGVEPQSFYDAISVSSGDSAALRAAFPRIRDGNYAPGFTVALMRKDLELAMGLSGSMTLPLAEAVLDYYRQAAPFDQEDSTAVAKVVYPPKQSSESKE